MLARIDLRELILWENQLSGYMPKELGNCSNLQMLALYGNTLVGSIPEEIRNLKLMEKLYLYRKVHVPGINRFMLSDVSILSRIFYLAAFQMFFA